MNPDNYGKIVEYLTKEEIIRGLNRHIEEYSKNPEIYFSTENSAMEYLNERLDGEEPSYGESLYQTIKYYAKQGE